MSESASRINVSILRRGVKPYSDIACECGGDTKVIDSRGSRGGIRRRRECLHCGTRFTTYEGRGEPSDEKELVAGEAMMKILNILRSSGLI